MSGFIFHSLPADTIALERERYYLVRASTFEGALGRVTTLACRNESLMLYDSGERASQLALELGLRPGQVTEITLEQYETFRMLISAIH